MDLVGIPLLPALFVITGLILTARHVSAGTLNPVNLWSHEGRLLSLFFLFYLVCGLINARWDQETFSIIYYLVTNFLLIQLILLFAHGQEALENIFLAACLGGTFASLAGIFQYLSALRSNELNYGLRAAGWWQNSGDFAMILSIVYLVSFYFINSEFKWRRLVAYLTQITVLSGILLSFTRAGLILVLIITVLNCRTFFKKIWYPAAFALIGAALFCFAAFSNSGGDGIIEKMNFKRLSLTDSSYAFASRLDLVQAGLIVFAHNPLFGTGFGNLLAACGNQLGAEVYPHNIYVSLPAESGIFTIMFYLAFLSYMLVRTVNTGPMDDKLRTTLKTFLITLVVMGFFSHQLLFEKYIAIILACLPVYYNSTHLKPEKM
jgi:hypothetical protein